MENFKHKTFFSLVLTFLCMVFTACVSLSPVGKEIQLLANSYDESPKNCVFIGEVKGSKEDALRNAAALLGADALSIKKVDIGNSHFSMGKAYHCNGAAVIQSQKVLKEKVEEKPKEEIKVLEEKPIQKSFYDDSEGLRKSIICQSKEGEWINSQCILHIE